MEQTSPSRRLYIVKVIQMRINNNMYSILDTIFKSDRNISATDISNKTNLCLERTTQLLRRLYADRCILRIKNKDEGYFYRYLTTKGMKVYGELNKVSETP